jgi:hypothetical protein
LRSRAGGHAQRHHGKQKKNTTAAAPHRQLGSAAQKIERVNLAGPPIGWVPFRNGRVAGFPQLPFVILSADWRGCQQRTAP